MRNHDQLDVVGMVPSSHTDFAGRNKGNDQKLETTSPRPYSQPDSEFREFPHISTDCGTFHMAPCPVCPAAPRSKGRDSPRAPWWFPTLWPGRQRVVPCSIAVSCWKKKPMCLTPSFQDTPFLYKNAAQPLWSSMIPRTSIFFGRYSIMFGRIMFLLHRNSELNSSSIDPSSTWESGIYWKTFSGVKCSWNLLEVSWVTGFHGTINKRQTLIPPSARPLGRLPVCTSRLHKLTFFKWNYSLLKVQYKSIDRSNPSYTYISNFIWVHMIPFVSVRIQL